ncbi:unnamed protein product [Gordionus sp. m RMFG-2023]
MPEIFLPAVQSFPTRSERNPVRTYYFCHSRDHLQDLYSRGPLRQVELCRDDRQPVRTIPINRQPVRTISMARSMTTVAEERVETATLVVARVEESKVENGNHPTGKIGDD